MLSLKRIAHWVCLNNFMCKTMFSKTKYTAVDISRKLGINYQTVNKRLNSPHAAKRWGVQFKSMPDGSIKRYVPESKLHLWRADTKYVGRPVFSK